MKDENRIRAFLISVTGYSILLLQQLPGIWVWIPLMAAPVFLLLGVLISNLPARITDIFQSLISLNEVILGKLAIIMGLIIVIYSIIYLGIKKRHGLVKTGLYRFIRHPQYLGFILLTIGFTGWSYYYIKFTFGISWISAEQTIGLWYIQMFLYFLLAFIEERHLTAAFGAEFTEYKNETSSFLPFAKSDLQNYLSSLIVFSLILMFVIQFPFT
ncbi:MAG: methyltransferase family protein [Candidatus Heimdallarchaeota archaeon]